MYEQGRLVDRLIAHWDTMRKDAILPEFARFNVGPIEDLWQQCVLFIVLPTVAGTAPSVTFYKLGDKVRALYGADMAGRTYNSVQRHFQGAAIVRRISEMLTDPQPIRDQGQFVNAENKMIKYRSCLLPFGADRKITHIVAGLSWREF